MNKTKRIRRTITVLLLAAFLLFGIAQLWSFRPASAAEETDAPPETAGMTDLLTQESEARLVWAAPAGVTTTADLTYDAQGADFRLGNTQNLLSAAMRVSHKGKTDGRVIHKFTVDLTDHDYSYSTFIFRAGDIVKTSKNDPSNTSGENIYNPSDTVDFIALAFRKEVGAVKIVSRYDDTFYTADNDKWSGAKGGYPLAINVPELLAGGSVEVVIESDFDHVRVWFNGVLGYETALLHPMPPATGIFAYSGASSYSDFTVKDARCYTADLTTYNNAVGGDSVVYSPLGGGGAQATAGADGMTLSPGSSREGMAVFSAPILTSQRVVQTYSFALNTPAANRLEWYTVLLRASTTMDEYLALRIRRGYGQVVLFGKINGFHCTYASNEPFDSRNLYVFPKRSISGMTDLPEGMVMNLTIVSDVNGIVVYHNDEVIYKLFYKDLEFQSTNENSPDGFEISTLGAKIAELPVATGMMHGPKGGYSGATYTGVNCYYGGEAQTDDIRGTFLETLTYQGEQVEGFTPGTFEYDVTVSSSETVDHNALAAGAEEGVSVSAPVWSVNERTGFEEAEIAISRSGIVRTYRLTFEVYDPPKPFVPEPWSPGGGLESWKIVLIVLGSVAGAAGIACAIVFPIRKKKKKGGA